MEEGNGQDLPLKNQSDVTENFGKPCTMVIFHMICMHA